MLITTIGLSMLQQQAQLRQFLPNVRQRSLASTLLDNNTERALAKQALTSMPAPFKFSTTKNNSNVVFTISWNMDFINQDNACCSLHRSLST